MNPTKGRTPGWKIAALVLAGVAAVAGAAYGWLRAVESRRWDEMEATLLALEQETESRSGERPVLYGEPTAGNAWDHYERAREALKGLGRPTIVSEYVARVPRVDRERARQMVAGVAPALENLRKGSRCGTAAPTRDWRASSRQILPSQELAQLMIAQARFWAEEGRTSDAARLLLDCARMSADIGANAETLGWMVSMAALYQTFDEIRELIAHPSIGKEDLLFLDAGLERLDRSLPSLGVAIVNGAMAEGWELHRAPSLDGYVDRMCAAIQATRPPISSWRYGFSRQLLIASFFEQHLHRCRRVASLEDRPWPEARDLAGYVDSESGSSKNPLVKVIHLWTFTDSQCGLMGYHRERRAQLRLLRMAARHRATGEFLRLEDPFGGTLSHAEKEGRLMLWSRGRDGVDDGGAGEWQPPRGKDIVLEVKR